MSFHSASLRLTFVIAVGLGTVGCQYTAVAMDDPQAYGPGAAPPAGLNAYCSTMARDVVAWGTLPSAWCAPYGPSWYGPYPYSYYGRPYGRTWRGPGWSHYRGHPGRGFGGGWRGGRGGRR
jgi:hypothetical protein